MTLPALPRVVMTVKLFTAPSDPNWVLKPDPAGRLICAPLPRKYPLLLPEATAPWPYCRARLAEPEPFFALDPARLSEPPRKAASISGATRSARRVTLAELSPVDLVVMGCVAAGEDGARLGKGGGFADLEFALATSAGLIGPHTVCVTTVHELQVCAAGTIPLTGHDVPLDFIVTPERVIDCRRDGPRPAAGIRWDDLTEEKIAAIPLLLAAQRELAQESR